MKKCTELLAKKDIFLFDIIIFVQKYLQTHNKEEVVVMSSILLQIDRAKMLNENYLVRTDSNYSSGENDHYNSLAALRDVVHCSLAFLLGF